MSENLPAVKKKIPDGLAYHVAISKASENSYDKKGNKLPPLFTDEEICSEHGMAVSELAELRTDPDFIKAVLLCLRDVKENGDAIRIKQRMLFQHYSETWIPELFDTTKADEHVAEKNKALVTMAKLGGLEIPIAKEFSGNGTAVNTPSLNIYLSSAPPVIQQPMKDINVIDNEAS